MEIKRKLEDLIFSFDDANYDLGLMQWAQQVDSSFKESPDFVSWLQRGLKGLVWNN